MTKFASHEALKLIAWRQVDFDERVVGHRVVNSGKDYDQKNLDKSTVWNAASVSVFPAEPPVLLHEATTGLLLKTSIM